MSITLVDGQLDAVRAEAASAQSQFTATVSTIESDTKLSEQGKSEEIAQWREATKSTLDKLREKEHSILDGAILDREKQIDAKMGNTASDLIAFRDAQDRAERIESADEALRIIERAVRTNDSSLAGAVLRRSLSSGWATPVEMLTKAKPELADAVNDLKLFTRFRDDTFSRAVAYVF